jgi:hypothetical protein
MKKNLNMTTHPLRITKTEKVQFRIVNDST